MQFAMPFLKEQSSTKCLSLSVGTSKTTCTSLPPSTTVAVMSMGSPYHEHVFQGIRVKLGVYVPVPLSAEVVPEGGVAVKTPLVEPR